MTRINPRLYTELQFVYLSGQGLPDFRPPHCWFCGRGSYGHGSAIVMRYCLFDCHYSALSHAISYCLTYNRCSCAGNNLNCLLFNSIHSEWQLILLLYRQWDRRRVFLRQPRVETVSATARWDTCRLVDVIEIQK